MTQKQALDILKLGHNVFLTGPPGSGKTYLLNQYINYLKQNKVGVAVTASTGIASTHLGGKTVHSWSGIGIKEVISEKYLKELLSKFHVVERIKYPATLIIDEISMLHAYQLDMIDKVCRVLRKNINPFGGLQIIFSGDFFQLPPVQNRETRKPKFVTESYTWPDSKIKVCYLEEQHRHTTDRKLTRVLEDIRNRSITKETIDILSSRKDKKINSRIQPTKIFTLNEDVDAINRWELDKINTKEYTYYMSSEGEEKLINFLKGSCLAPEELILKKGAEVMFVKNNFDAGYINGTRGKVIDFDEDDYPIIKTFNGEEITALPTSWVVEENDIVKARISQIPLRLAWAITVHKSQGMTIDTAEIDLSKAFEEGMGYVALSRIKKLSGLKLQGLNKTALLVSDKAVELDKKFPSSSGKSEQLLKQLDKTRLQKEFVERNKRKENDIIPEEIF